MGTGFFHWILVGIIIKITGSLEISDSKSGSKSCNLTLRINPSSLSFTGYQSLEIFKHANAHSDYLLMDCRVHSVKILRGFHGKIPLKRQIFTRMVTKKHNAKLEVILRHRDFKHLPVNELSVLVELNCNGRRCSLLSAGHDTIKKSILQYSWLSQRRKLLSLGTDNSVDNMDHPVAAAPVLLAVVGIIVLIVALAMCACGNNSHEKALSNEVGGTEIDHHVVAVATNKLEEGQMVTEHETLVKQAENDGSSNNRRTTNESKKKERNSQSTTENGAAGRTASQSSQTDKRSMGEVEPRPRSSGSHNSEDKFEEVPLLESSTPETGAESETPERNRTASDKEKELKDSSSSSEARTRTDSSEGAKKSIFRLPSRKRTGSDGKEPKSSPEENTEQKSKLFWNRRKSSKTKGNSEITENISPKKEKKKKKSESQKHSTPEHVQSSSRPVKLPLPPRPSSVSDEEAQYEVVETRAQRPKSNTEDADYETVTTSMTRTYDKVNVVVKNQSRPASELYECINDQNAKMKRVSSGSNQYDVVETRGPPPKKPPQVSEYAYAVVASRDKPLIPTETSSGSGLYEIVTDDIKQQSGVLDTRKSDIVVEDADYAVVQKNPFKKRVSKKDEDEHYSQVEKQREKSLSGEIDPAPAPPPVSSLIHVSASVRRRTQSEGDELNLEHSESPADPASPKSDRPQTMFEVEATYAKVNLAMKKRHSVEAAHPSHEFAPAADLPEGFYEESDTPPPVPPSIYADLESMRKDNDEANDDQSPSTSTQQQNESEENAYEEVAIKDEIKSSKKVRDMKITQAIDRTDSDNQMDPKPLKSPEDPNGVLKRLKPPLGSPRNSDGRLSAGSLEGEKRFSTGSQHDYDEVLTINITQTHRSSPATESKDSTSGHNQSIENETTRNSTGPNVGNPRERPTMSERAAEKIITPV